MTDKDDFDDIPPLVPPRDEVVSRHRSRHQPEMVSQRHQRQYVDRVKVSTWPVRILLALIILGMGAGASYAYSVHQELLTALDYSERRIRDLENRLALVGDSTEETAGNILERVDLNFSEIDKLWAARNVTNRSVQDLTGRVANIETSAAENTTAIADTSQRLVQSTSLVEDVRRDVTGLRNELNQNNERLVTLSNSLQAVQGRTQELMALRDSAAGSETVAGGLNDRLMRVEEAVEAIDAYRMQMNQAMLRLQERIDAIR